MSKIFSKEVLYAKEPQRSFESSATEVAFLLGGIGTGNVSLGARGELRDWEIFNRPGKGQSLPYCFFAIRTKQEGKEPIAKIMEGKMVSPFSKSHGFSAHEMAGVPRFAESSFRGEYPMGYLTLRDPLMPVSVELTAFNPLIPLDADNSGIPCAILTYAVKNTTDEKTQVSVVGTLPNIACRPHSEGNIWGNWNHAVLKDSVNELRTCKGVSAIHFTNAKADCEDKDYSDMALGILGEGTLFALPTWPDRGWWDAAQMMWDHFTQYGSFEKIKVEEKDEHSDTVKPGTIGMEFELVPGEEKKITFVITWNSPIRLNGWYEDQVNSCCSGDCCCKKEVYTKNYYATLFRDSWATMVYVEQNKNKLYNETMRFHDALFESTLPPYVLDAVSANIDILRSTTCFRLKNGKFFGWEGCFATEGCCEGNCTHVWNYQQTLAFLFPVLERDMRLTEFNVETQEDGKMEFRTKKLFGGNNNFHPAADGQLGCIIRLYRDWKLCGDDSFLRLVWDNAKRALDFAFTYWDKDGDFVLDSQQHNTYDIEFYGPNSLVNSMFFGALKAGAEMALAMDEPMLAVRYTDALEKGSAKMDELLWNGEYYAQKIDDVNQYLYQYGQGCLSDQLLGQQLSHVAGLSHVLPQEHVKSAVKAIFEHNFLEDFSNHNNVQRCYALNDEKGLLLCTWPTGGRPELPFTYSDEVWTGIEYQVASHLIYEGFVEEGLTVVKALRDRHDGYRRNPWNEVECGNHYARAMASWGVLLALSGYKADLINHTISFSPRLYDCSRFQCFFSCDKGWGVFKKEEGECSVRVLYGELDGVEFFCDGKKIDNVTKDAAP